MLRPTSKCSFIRSFTQISFFSTSPTLSNRERFPYFLRTIPSDVYQAEVIVALVKKLGWTYVSVVYEESSYGILVGGLSLIHI